MQCYKSADFLCWFSESIFGYKDLRINIYCTAGNMKTYVKVNYAHKVNPEDFDGVQVVVCYNQYYKVTKFAP